MKILNLCILFSISLSSYSQIKIDKKISKKYDELVLKLSTGQFKEFFSDSETNTTEGLGIAIFTKFKIDTLNLKDFNNDSSNSVKLFNVDTGLEDVVVDEKLTFPYPDFINAKLINNKLTISIGFLGPNIIYTIEHHIVQPEQAVKYPK